ncbi:hypothetical protein O6H91_02G002200 [Diphasiastrum complanatum]|uniref:Uncharacterized protein n=1 Tax=Diphasiastrum complanatum TaxID=34168 RepID=A0ACC2EBW3_DIPCM|nr:hypothetical protein O6H91_02G002200 [Diphasiastrum complanatum]
MNFWSVLAVLMYATSISAQPDYKDALSKCLLFFEAQRSGKLPLDQRITWRGDSALNDGTDAQVDLSGGYYDAGDNIKYTFPMAFTITMLSWGAIEYGVQYGTTSELQHLQDSIRWGTDYLLKAYSGPTQLWVQVGDAVADHHCWERPEDMDTPRTTTQVNETSPGTEVTAETAAALAAASIVFRVVDIAYSIKLLNASLALFNFSNNNQSSYTGECPFYCSYSGYYDELLWAASWLYKATLSSYYLEYLIEYKSLSTSISEFSWDMKLAGVQVLLSKFYFQGESSLLQYKQQADDFFCFVLPNSTLNKVHYTPGGLLYMRDGANTQYATGASFLSAVYADYLPTTNMQLTCGNTSFSKSDIFGFVSSQVFIHMASIGDILLKERKDPKCNFCGKEGYFSSRCYKKKTNPSKKNQSKGV